LQEKGQQAAMSGNAKSFDVKVSMDLVLHLAPGAQPH
jgi:hypothetical protein